MQRFTKQIRAQASLIELRDLLARILTRPDLHARLVNTLSRMEYIGVRKMLKARHAAQLSGRIALADDSGLSVAALDGAPGIFSARWAGPTKDFGLAMKKIENALGQNPDRNAQFICALSLAWPDGHCDTFEGKVAGKLTFPPRGSEGFGYDPIFIPEGFDITFGEMDPAKKHEMSHRADAFRQLVAACFS